MKEQPLALRHRPKKLSEIVGQKKVVGVLKGVFAGTRALPGAIMFTGPSGVGKTTLARLVVRYLNCEEGLGKSCGKCASCLAIDSNTHPDFEEVGASGGNVETVKKLIESQNFMPRYRIRSVLMDEIHRASHQAVNDLLIPVEEPPKTSLWMFATSEPDKISNSKALKSRCLILNLEPPSKEEIAERILDISDDEGLDWMNEKAGETLSEASGGSVRAAIQTLESLAYTVSGMKGKLPKGKALRKLIGDASVDAAVDTTDRLALSLLFGLYELDPKRIVSAVLDTTDHIGLITKAMNANHWLIGTTAVGRHKSLWSSRVNTALLQGLKDKGIWEGGRGDIFQAADLSSRLHALRETLLTVSSGYSAVVCVNQLLAAAEALELGGSK